VGYRFENRPSSWLGGTRVRLGVVNLTDKAPPISSGGFGYNPGVSQSLLAGRSWSLELTKSF
jgi:outer membrane receptor protein involved in Fe transport